MENQEQQVNTESQPQEQSAPAQPELSISDLQNLRAVVETAARRGAFQASELSAVGGVFDRLNTFLNAVLPKPATPEQEPSDQQAA